MKNFKKMETKNQIKVCAVAILLGGSLTMQAQDQDTKLNREMTLEREYDPSVQDANKVNRMPDVQEPTVTKHAIEYSPFTTPTAPEKEITVLPSGNVMTAIPYNNRRGYFHFGGGMYMNLSGDFGYHILDDETDFLNVYVSHRSTNGKLKYFDWSDEKQKAKLNDNLGSIHFRHNFDFGTMRLGGKYGYTAFNYYGFQLDSIYRLSHPNVNPLYLANRDENQVNQMMNAYVGIQSRENAMLGYLLDLEYRRFSQKYGWTEKIDGVRENKFTIRAGVSSRFNSGDQSVGIFGKLDYFNYNYPSNENWGDSIGYSNHMQLTVTPYYRVEGETWKVQLGANLMLITGDSSKFFVSPNISAEAEVADQTVLYGNATGEIGVNDAYSISRLNRYTDHALMVKPSRTWLDLNVGIRSGVVPGLWFDIFGGYKITQNEVFFVPANYINQDYDFGNYSLAYQPDANRLQLGAALKYSYQKWVDFSLKGVYNNWSLSDGDGDTWLSGKYTSDKKAYGRPEIEFNADLAIRPISPLTVSFGYYLGASRYTLFYGEEIKMKNINDLNATVAYNINDTFGVYAKANNMLFQEQELWYGYPMQKFNAMVGININF